MLRRSGVGALWDGCHATGHCLVCSRVVPRCCWMGVAALGMYARKASSCSATTGHMRTLAPMCFLSCVAELHGGLSVRTLVRGYAIVHRVGTPVRPCAHIWQPVGPMRVSEASECPCATVGPRRALFFFTFAHFHLFLLRTLT